MKNKTPHLITVYDGEYPDEGLIMLTESERAIIGKFLNEENWIGHYGYNYVDIVVEPLSLKQVYEYIEMCKDGLDKCERESIDLEFRSNPELRSWIESQSDDVSKEILTLVEVIE